MDADAAPFVPDREQNASPDASLSDEDAAVLCETCLERAAVVSCSACEMLFCHHCAQQVHDGGARQRHVDDGCLRAYAKRSNANVNVRPLREEPAMPQDAWHAEAAALARALPADGKTRGLKLNPHAFGGKQDAENEVDDPDQEKSPTPEAQTASTTDAFDIWRTAWSTRSISETSSSIEGIQWRGNRSLSIDTKPSSPALARPDELALSSLSKSLHSLSFVSPTEEVEPSSPIFETRPRSFSDYTSLSTSKVPEPMSEHRPPSLVSTSTQQMWHAIKSSFVSRHVVVLNECGSFDSSSRRGVDDLLKSCGAIASARDELAADGLLFRTFFELKAAVRAVSLFSSNSMGVSVAFALPYELPNEVNCASVLVQLVQAAPVPANEIRQYCAAYGEVASVLHNDVQSGKYIVEYNDSRDVVNAMLGLSCTLLPCGSIHVARSHPPTLDMGILHLVQSRMDEMASEMVRYSNNSTSVLTSPSSVSSSPVEASFLDGNISDMGRDDRAFSPLMPAMRVSTSFDASSLSLSSPHSNDLWMSSRDRTPKGRPRSSSAYASFSSAAARSVPIWTSNLAPPIGAPPMSGVYGFRFGHPSHGFSGQASTQRSSFHSRSVSTSGNVYNTGRGDGFGMTTRRSFSGSIGRHDQGTGEFSLDLDRVITGEDTRTTLMIRNIPNKYTQHMLLAEINRHHHGQYDFFYLPIDFKNKCNVGYAFINFIEPARIVPFCREFDNQKWTNFNSEKVCAISYARLQGKQAMITRFQNSSLLDKHESYRPLVFHSTGPKRGQPEPFPAPKHQPFHRRNTVTGTAHSGGGSGYGTPRMYAAAAQCGVQMGPPMYIPIQHHTGHGSTMYGYQSAPMPPPPPQEAAWPAHQGTPRNSSTFEHRPHYGSASRSTDSTPELSS